jgi:hypothetical protein
MEASSEYRVTLHRGRRPDSPDATVIFRDVDEGAARAFYRRCLPPQPGVVIAVWRPDGSMIAFATGPTR